MTGGVGCGKSAVLQYLEEAYGAAVIRSDDVARDLMEPGGACYPAVKEMFGPSCIREDGSLDRAAIAAKVFADEDLRLRLNALTHPAVWEEIRRRFRAEEEKGTPVICLESALLTAEKNNETYDELWYVYASEPVRRERLKASRSYSDERIDAVMASQEPEEEFRKGCDHVIDNSGSFADTRRQIDALLKG